MEENILIALGLTIFAGLATGIGSLIALFAKNQNTRYLTVAMGFSAGVMIYVSFAEMLPEAIKSLIEVYGERQGNWIGVVAFFLGMFFIALIDRFTPSPENPHEFFVASADTDAEKTEAIRRSKLMRVGLFTAFSLALHNFPEGIATFMAAAKDPSVGIPIAIAIAIHNIPEGIAVSMPIFYATGNRRKAFIYSFLSGVAEPVGAFVGYLLLMPFWSDSLAGMMLSFVGGIMVFISFDQLLPAAEEYGEHHLSIYGLVSGMIVMAISLLLFI